MIKKLDFCLHLPSDQQARLQALFVQDCNLLAPLVAQMPSWNLVGPHHLAYRRERFPWLG